MKYDVFISYRRDAFESANLIAEKLRSAGYSVFFDLETLRAGKFNEQLLAEIEQCTDFVVVLPQNGLDRCADPEDWVRREVCHAMKHGKNIVPVMLAGFQWPKPMPEGMEELANYQAITATAREYFDLSMKRLMGYLQSKPHKKQRRFLLKVAAVVAAVAVVAVIGYFSFRLLALPVCTETASAITKGMGVLDLLGQDNRNMQAEWERFKQQSIVRGENDTAQLKHELQTAIEHYRTEVARLQAEQPAPAFNKSNYRLFLLGLYGINAAELTAFEETYLSMFDELTGQLESLADKVERNELNTLNQRMTDSNFQGYQHLLNMLYYGYMETLSLFPEASRELHNSIAPSWRSYPNGVGLGLTKEEYQRFQQQESNAYEDLLKEVEIKITQDESDLDDLEKKIDKIEQMATESMSQATPAAPLPQGNEAALNAQKADVESKRAQLAEIERQYAETYQRMKDKCRLRPEDEQSYMWGKLMHWATFMNTIAESQRKTAEQGIAYNSPVTPQMALDDLNLLLDDYFKFHPEAAAYLPAMRAFYADVAQGRRPLGGVLVFGFKDDAVHPLLKPGDIVVERNRKPVNRYADLQKALSEGGDGTIAFLRLDNKGQLETFRTQMPDTKILVGYMELRE